MGLPITNPKIARNLYPWEITQARFVFRDTLCYEKVLIHEYAKWPDTIDNLGRKLKKDVPRKPDEHNAITIGYGCYFPVGLPLNQPGIHDPDFYKICWLIHELTHCWQYQRFGMKYIFWALQAQFKLGSEAYRIGDAHELVEKRLQGFKFFDFNLEQQGRLNEKFFVALNNLPEQQDMYDACRPYITDEMGLA
jgi:hypothetical protein